YVHAQDRLFQIELLSRLSQGKLSELLGPKLIDTDKFFRTLGIRKTLAHSMESHPKHYTGKWIKYYTQYLNGLNHYIKTSRTPLEYRALGQSPMKFELLDLMSISGYLSFSFAVGIRKDPLITSLDNKLSKEVLSKLFVGYHPKAATSITAKIPSQFIDKLNSLYDIIPPFIGSNSWVVSADKSTTGKPVLVNDPHIGYSNPSVWYEADLYVGQYKSHGYYLAGFPFALVGHTTNHAWALTMLENDDLDLFEETIDHKNKTVVFKNNLIPLSVRKETILVKKQDPIELEILESPHGPLVNQFLKIKSQHDKDIALFWEYYHPANRMFESFYDINHAQNMSQFRTGVSKLRAPGLNISYVDHKNIAWWSAARLFKRKSGSTGDHLLNGATGQDEIEGYIPFSENPHLVNPKKGYIFTANGQPDTKNPIEGYFMPKDRSVRISQLLQAKDKLSIQDHKEIQNDNVLVTASKGHDILLKHMDPKAYPLLVEMQKTLQAWDKQFSLNSIASSIYMEWSYQFLHRILKDSLNQNERDVYIKLPNAQHFLDVLYDTQDLSFLKLDFKKQLNLALLDTHKLLSKRYGSKIQNWTWSKYHTISYDHVFSKNPMTKPLFHLGPYPIDGVKEAINSVSAKLDDNRFFAKSGPSVRRIVDMSNINQSYSILPT
ncbi:penicillin acylase family protein, partial [bacterium]|nr:penicillin acylase family protein [bacterium]